MKARTSFRLTYDSFIFSIYGVLAQRSIDTIYVAAGAILVVTSAATLSAPQLD